MRLEQKKRIYHRCSDWIFGGINCFIATVSIIIEKGEAMSYALIIGGVAFIVILGPGYFNVSRDWDRDSLDDASVFVSHTGAILFSLFFLYKVANYSTWGAIALLIALIIEPLILFVLLKLCFKNKV